MKFKLLISLSLLMLASTAAADTQKKDIWAGTDYEYTDVAMELNKVSEHVYYVQGMPGAATDHDGFISNACAVVTNDSVVVFDSLGTPSLAYLFLSKIREVTDKPIKMVIASHYHADHIYGLQVFKDLGATVIAPLGAKDYLASPAAQGRLKERRESLFPWVNESTHIVKPDQYIDKNKTLTVGGVTLEITPLGSTHSQGDQMVYVKPDRVLLAGDLMFEGRIPFVAGSQPDNWLKQLKTLDVSKIDVIIPGHGPASRNPAQALKFTREYLEFLNDKMGEAVDNLTPFDEAYKAIDWSRYKKYPAFIANRMNAYFMYLRLEAASVQ
jgi:glyoxylase-like metal-dependent hydrolase (beta-lactamase superfamily II)